MPRSNIRTLVLLFVAIAATAYAGWRIYVVGPEKKCLARQGVWNAAHRHCDLPVSVQKPGRS